MFFHSLPGYKNMSEDTDKNFVECQFETDKSKRPSRKPDGQVCRMNTTGLFQDDCRLDIAEVGPNVTYGYEQGQPCILLKLNLVREERI